MRNKFIALGDIHFPYHNPNALDYTLSFISKFKPKYIILLGDIVDCYSLSRFDKDPSRILSLQKEFDYANSFIKELRSIAPYSKIIYIEGNHERRLQKYLNSHPEIASIRSLTVPTLLGLDSLQVPYLSEFELGGIIFTHGEVVRKYSGQSARGEMEINDSNGVSGHTHRLALIHKSTRTRDLQWAEAGCLCTLTPDYIDHIPDWQNGFVYGELINDEINIWLKKI